MTAAVTLTPIVSATRRVGRSNRSIASCTRSWSLAPAWVAPGGCGSELTRPEWEYVDDLFADSLYPVLTPLAIDPGHPFPHNLSCFRVFCCYQPRQPRCKP